MNDTGIGEPLVLIFIICLLFSSDKIWNFTISMKSFVIIAKVWLNMHKVIYKINKTKIVSMIDWFILVD